MIRNYNQLTIKQFLQCRTIADLEPDPITRKVKMLSVISGESIDTIESLPISELVNKLKAFSEVENTLPDSKVRMKFKVKGQRFECVWRVQELSAAQYIDVSHFTKEPENIVSNIHNILASIAVKKTWYGKKLKYNGDHHKETADLFYNHLKISQAYPVMLFFCKYSAALEHNIITCMKMEVDKTREAIKRSTVNGAGLQQ